MRSTHGHKIGKQAAFKSQNLKKLHKINFAKLPVGSRPPPLFEEGRINIHEWFRVRETELAPQTLPGVFLDKEKS